MARVTADDSKTTRTADHLALVASFFDGGFDFHGECFLVFPYLHKETTDPFEGLPFVEWL